MKKNNIIRFVESLILLPFMTGGLTGNLININSNNLDQTVFIQKQNIGADGLLAINQPVDLKAQEKKAKAEAIDTYFASHEMPLAGVGMKMVEEAEKNNLDWRLIPAIAVRESTGGKFDCIKAENNPFGWASCKVSFESTDQAIEVVAKNLGGNNPKTERHYAGKGLKGILQAYNPPSIVPRYAEQVISIMNAIGPEEIETASLTME